MKLLFLSLCACPAFTHTLSLSTGDLSISGTHATYRLRMPQYELQHIAEPSKTLGDAIILPGATRRSVQCGEQEGQYQCVTEWDLINPPAEVEVECHLASVTVPGHVHVLHARLGSRLDEAVFEGSTDSKRLRFRTVGPLESAVRSRPGLLLATCLSALVFAAAGNGVVSAAVVVGFSMLIAMFFAPLAPKFLDAAAAITTAYAGFETLLDPRSRFRFIPTVLFGAILACYWGVLTRDVPARLTATGTPLIIGSVAGLLLSKREKFRRVLGGVLLVSGLALSVFLLR